jgi:hypothetical protein
MLHFIENLSYNYLDVSKIALFNYFKTGNLIYDTIISTTFITLFTIGLNYVNKNKDLFSTNLEDIIYLFLKKNIVIIEGKNCFVSSLYGDPSVNTSIYSDRFNALWEYIINNIENNPTIYKIKETHTNIQGSATTDENKYKLSDLYIVYQQKSFLLDKHIYASSKIINENDENEKQNRTVKTHKITIEIYSYKYSLNYNPKMWIPVEPKNID